MYLSLFFMQDDTCDTIESGTSNIEKIIPYLDQLYNNLEHKV